MKRMMRNVKKKAAGTAAAIMIALFAVFALPLSAHAETAGGNEAAVEQEEEGDAVGTKAMAAALALGLASAVGAVSMGVSISKASDSISRQPEAAKEIRTTLMLGLVFVETAIIYALIVAILIIFVL